MNDKWLEWAVKIQSISQTGLTYCKDPYDRERYEQLRCIAADIMSERSGLPKEKIQNLFCNEEGYQTPKIDTRAAIFRNDKILLVHEKNGAWSMPGGWCDVDMSVAENTVKEVMEETGLRVSPERLIAVHDWRKHNVCNYAYGVIKIFVLCHEEGGSFTENIETVGTQYFGRDELPEQLATEKNTAEQILMCFDSNEKNDISVQFD